MSTITYSPMTGFLVIDYNGIESIIFQLNGTHELAFIKAEKEGEWHVMRCSLTHDACGNTTTKLKIPLSHKHTIAKAMFMTIRKLLTEGGTSICVDNMSETSATPAAAPDPTSQTSPDKCINP